MYDLHLNIDFTKFVRTLDISSFLKLGMLRVGYRTMPASRNFFCKFWRMLSNGTLRPEISISSSIEVQSWHNEFENLVLSFFYFVSQILLQLGTGALLRWWCSRFYEDTKI